jgi:hypothetical protein
MHMMLHVLYILCISFCGVRNSCDGIMFLVCYVVSYLEMSLLSTIVYCGCLCPMILLLIMVIESFL